MSRLAKSGLLMAAGGLALHIMLLLSVFDIYFRSPVVSGVAPHYPHHFPVARRLVLFSVDGLRAESFLEHTRTPFLRSIAKSRGLWGVSNTRVPTESRPGHVAIIAGFYEDPSAVAKGWKKNPVDFDSVFNQSRYTWSWGVDDILHIFSKGTNDGHIFTYSYQTKDQNFNSNKNTTLLDGWVFDKVKSFFQNASNDKALMSKLTEDKIVLFLHLLGMDTSGHTHKPNSRNFLVNLEYVDEGIAQMEQLIETFYQHDGQTTYIMTSDHGMTDWGSHGAGGKHETETPYVMWGAGVAQSIPGTPAGSVYGLPADRRQDINQADFAPLMSTIISVPVPVNSVGQLPADLLNMTLENKAKAIYSNSRQLASQYNTMRDLVEKNAIHFLYYPFEPFSKEKFKEMMSFTEKLLDGERFEKLILLSEEITRLSLTGLSYYYNYYQSILLAFISLSFSGWIFFLLTMLLEQKRNTNINVNNKSKLSQIKMNSSNNAKLNVIFMFIFIVLGSVIFLQGLPIQYYVYCLVPVALWWRVISAVGVWVGTVSEVIRQQSVLRLLWQLVCFIIGTVALVSSFDQRWWLSIPLFGMAVWPFVSSEREHLPWTLLLCWACSCILLGVFSYLPVVGKQAHILLVILAGLIWLVASLVFLRKILLPLYLNGVESAKEVTVIGLQMALLVLALSNIYIQSKRFEESSPVVVAHQVLAWILAVASLLMPLISSARMVCRLFAIYGSLLTFYLLLSVSHEGLFLISLVVNQLCWLLIEFQLSHSSKSELAGFTFASYESEENKRESLLSIERSLTEHDFRRAFFFLLYIILSFFGTGNIASLNSFEVRWVTCFVTTFQPFIITALVLSKTLVPFLIVACTFRAVSMITKICTLSDESPQRSTVHVSLARHGRSLHRGRFFRRVPAGASSNNVKSDVNDKGDHEGSQGDIMMVTTPITLEFSPTPTSCAIAAVEPTIADLNVTKSVSDLPCSPNYKVDASERKSCEVNTCREPLETTDILRGEHVCMCEEPVFSRAPTGYLIVIVMIFSNMMGLQFLHYVKNTGSWLEIGTSISQYVIAEVITLFIVVLHVVAKVLTETNVGSFVVKVFKSGKKYV